MLHFTAVFMRPMPVTDCLNENYPIYGATYKYVNGVEGWTETTPWFVRNGRPIPARGSFPSIPRLYRALQYGYQLKVASKHASNPAIGITLKFNWWLIAEGRPSLLKPHQEKNHRGDVVKG